MRTFNNAKKHSASVRMPAPAPCGEQRGFSLLELMLSMALLLIFIAAAFSQITQLQKKTASETSRVEMNQEAREFIEQTVRDLRQAGYPKASMFADPNTNTNDPWVAAGIVSVSPTQLVLEGDVNNDGQVYSVTITYLNAVAGDPNCPCIRRSAVAKVAGSPMAQGGALNYVETEHVMAPGIGPGQSGEDLFAYYDQNGNNLSANVGTGVDLNSDSLLPPGQQVIPTIKTVKINLSLLSNVVDPDTGNPIRTSLSSSVRLNQ